MIDLDSGSNIDEAHGAKGVLLVIESDLVLLVQYRSTKSFKNTIEMLLTPIFPPVKV